MCWRGVCRVATPSAPRRGGVASVADVTARPDSPASSASPESTGATSAPPESGGRLGLLAAVALAAAGALLIGLAPLVGVADGAEPAFTSWPWLLVLAALPPALAALSLRAGKRGLAAGLLITPAVLAPGRLVLDAQLVVGAVDVARPELLKPTTLDPLPPAPGTWMLLAAHVLTGLAGAVAAATAGDRGSAAPAFGSEEPLGPDSAERAQRSGARRQGLLALVLCAAFTAGVGSLMTQLASDDPYLVPHAAVDSSVLVLVGSVLFAIGIPSAGGLAVSSADPEFARGGLLGLALAMGAYAVPSLAAATFVPTLHYGSGAVYCLLAALALAALAAPAGRVPQVDEHDLNLPAGARLSTTAGALAVLAGGLGAAGAASPVLQVSELFLSNPATYPARMLWPAGVVVLVLGAALLWRPVAPRVRPALVVAWAALPLATAGVLDSVFTSLQVPGTFALPGTWLASAGALLGALAAVVAAVAGAIERDDVDLTERTWRPLGLAPAALVVLLALGAFSLPAVTAPEYVEPGLFRGFSTASWGEVIALAAVVGAAVLVPRSRPARAAGLLAGAALVLLVRALEFPLTQGRVPGSAPGPAVWCSAGGIVVALLGAVVLALRGERAPVVSSGGDPAVEPPSDWSPSAESSSARSASSPGESAGSETARSETAGSEPDQSAPSGWSGQL